MEDLDIFIKNNHLQLSGRMVRIEVPEEAGAYRRFLKLLVLHLVLHCLLRFATIPFLSCASNPQLWSLLIVPDMLFAQGELWLLEDAPDSAPMARQLAVSTAMLTALDIATPIQRYFLPETELVSCSTWFKMLRPSAMLVISVHAALWLYIHDRDERRATHNTRTVPVSSVSITKNLFVFIVITYVSIKIRNLL